MSGLRQSTVAVVVMVVTVMAAAATAETAAAAAAGVGVVAVRRLTAGTWTTGDPAYGLEGTEGHAVVILVTVPAVGSRSLGH